METFESPFLTFTNVSTDANYLGDELELAALHRRVEALDEALRTGENFDVLLDMLAEDEQDVIDYVEGVRENVELVIAQNLVPEDWNLWKKALLE